MPQSQHTARLREIFARKGLPRPERRTDQNGKDVLLLNEEIIMALADQFTQLDGYVTTTLSQLATAQAAATADNPVLATIIQKFQAAGITVQVTPPADPNAVTPAPAA